MRLHKLVLKNIGPFDEAELDFTHEGEVAMVTVITGENGTGKTLLLDAVRTMFGTQFAPGVRPVARPGKTGDIEIVLGGEAGTLHSQTDRKFQGHPKLRNLPGRVANGHKVSWVVDYWSSAAATDPFEIKNLQAADASQFLNGALSGVVRNPDTTQFICQVDYLRDSRDADEQAQGEALWVAIQRVAEVALINGRLDRVRRASLTPIFIQHGRELELQHLNAGTLYIIQRMLGLLRRMFACAVLNGRSEAMLETPGLLLIDEAENHLHPKWQKRFLPLLRELFPNVQIVATTHSPFIVASAPSDARIFVCEEMDGNRCVVHDVSREYGSLPIDEVLASPAFSETLPFSQDVTRLVEDRKRAISTGNDERRAEIERQLKELNPDEFGYFDLPDDLRALLDTGS